MCQQETPQQIRNQGKLFLSSFLAVALLALLLSACAFTAPTRVPPAPSSTPAPAAASASPSPTEPPADLLAGAQQALAAYEPATDAQPLVNLLLSSIAAWLEAGGDPTTLEALLNQAAPEPGHSPVTVTEVDLSGDPAPRASDVLVRIPVMGLPLFVFVRQGTEPARFTGHALPPDLEAIRTDFPLEETEIDEPAVQLVDLTGDGLPEVLFTSLFPGASSYTLRPRAFQWHAGGFRLIFAADLVTWAGPSRYALEPDPSGQGALQIVLTYPRLYTHGFDHKLVDHPLGRQVWRWAEPQGRYLLAEQQVDLAQGVWEAGGPGGAALAVDRLRWLTNEGEAAFRAGRYGDALPWYEQVLAEAGAEGWQPEGDEPNWPIYAAFRRAEALLLQGGPASGLPEMDSVVTAMAGDLLGELARAFLQGYGQGAAPAAGPEEAAARGVAAMGAVDLYAHFYYERPGALRFPMDAGGILYPGAGLAAYLNAHPELAADPTGLRAGLEEIGFPVEDLALLEDGNLRITLRLPDLPYAGEEPVAWRFSRQEGSWRVSLPDQEGMWPTLGAFEPRLQPYDGE